MLWVDPFDANVVFRYDDLNRLTNMVDGIGSSTFSWTDEDQLALEDGPWADDAVSFQYQNRLRSSISVQAPNATAWNARYTYDDVMRLLEVASPAGSFRYDLLDIDL